MTTYKRNNKTHKSKKDQLTYLDLLQNNYPYNSYDGWTMPTQQMQFNSGSFWQNPSLGQNLSQNTTLGLDQNSMYNLGQNNTPKLSATPKSNFMSGLREAALGAGIGFLGNMGGNLIAGGKSSGIGNTIGSLGNTIGSAAMAVNPLVGGVIMGGTSLLGGAFNAIGGVKLNKKRIAQAENEINAVKNFNADASNFDDLMSQINNAPTIAAFSQKDIGSNSLLNKGATKEYNRLNDMREFAEAWKKNSIANAATNLQQQQMNTLLQNHAAYGGLLDYGSSSAINYDLANRQLGIESMKAMGQNRQYALPNLGLNTFAEGGGIHIKPSKKGTFTAAAKKHGKGVQEFASQVLANKENYSPAMVKKAVFAKNFGGRKKAFGGDLLTNGTVFSNNVIEVNNGGTHEESPYEGVQMGIDSQGVPNLVEEGETIWNDYVFSNRIPVPDAVRNKYKLRGTKDMTFSDAAKKIQKASEERPNDPIANDTLNINLTRLANEQEVMREQRNTKSNNKFGFGGKKDKDWYLNMYNSWLTNPENIGTNALDETIITTKDRLERAAKVEQDFQKNKEKNKQIDDLIDRDNLLRYAPALGSALGVGYGLLSKPNYSRADALAQYAQNAGKITPISYDPLGNYLTYRPVDMNYIANRMAAQAGATRRNIMNTSGGNRANAIGSLLAADYNSQIAQADAIRQGEDTNWNRLMQTETFNRGTDQYNSEAALKAAMANQEARMKASQLGLSGYTNAMQMKDAIDAQRAKTLSANLTNLFESLGQIGEEQFDRNRLKWLERKGVLRSDYFDTDKYNRNNKKTKG